VTVEDEGPGFNYGAVRMSLPDDPRRLQNRGYVLIKSLSEKLEFNDRGNCVTAYVSAAADTEQIVKEART
jgi:anti-sigma regulatory factor (Ser/Thr protein kinase)